MENQVEGIPECVNGLMKVANDVQELI